MATSHTEQTTRRFRVCETCGQLFHSVRSARLHQDTEGHHDGIQHITAEVQE